MTIAHTICVQLVSIDNIIFRFKGAIASIVFTIARNARVESLRETGYMFNCLADILISVHKPIYSGLINVYILHQYILSWDVVLIFLSSVKQACKDISNKFTFCSFSRNISASESLACATLRSMSLSQPHKSRYFSSKVFQLFNLIKVSVVSFFTNSV